MADSGAEIAKRWRERVAASTPKVTAGVNNVQESPMEKAANAEGKYLQGVTDAVNSGRFASGLRKVTLTDWKQSMLQKGIPRMAQGAQQAEGRFASFMNSFMPQVRQIQQEVNAMADNTFEERIQKMVANANALHSLKGTFAN